MNIRVKIQLGLILILIITAFLLIYSMRVSPDSPFFGLKRVQEKTFLALKFSPEDRIEYLSFLLDIRLREFEDLISKKSYSDLWSASLRYSTFAGQITDLTEVNNLKEMVMPLKNQFEEHKMRLTILYEVYPKNTDNVEWKYLLDAINYLDSYLEKLSKAD
jgi:hypothetical protein